MIIGRIIKVQNYINFSETTMIQIYFHVTYLIPHVFWISNLK